MADSKAGAADWQFLQCFGERTPGEDIQEGEQALCGARGGRHAHLGAHGMGAMGSRIRVHQQQLRCSSGAVHPGHTARAQRRGGEACAWQMGACMLVHACQRVQAGPGNRCGASRVVKQHQLLAAPMGQWVWVRMPQASMRACMRAQHALCLLPPCPARL